MPLNSSTLSSGLEALEPTDSVATATDRIATAFTDYMAESTVLGVFAISAILSAAPKAAMAGAMGSLNTEGGAAGAIAAGVAAFWSAMLGIEATIWAPQVPPTIIVPSTVIPPPGLGGMTAAIQGAFDGNVAGGLGLAAAAATVAAAIHGANAGATVQTQAVPSPPVVTPIL
ncbi:MAG: hypothetical protein ACWGQW_01350 [bacterium]